MNMTSNMIKNIENIQVPITNENIDLIIDRSLEQLFINCMRVVDKDGRLLLYSDEYIINKIKELLDNHKMRSL